MKKRIIATVIMSCMTINMLTGCNGNAQAEQENQSAVTQEPTASDTQTDTASVGAVQVSTEMYTGNQIELKEMLDHFGDQEFIDVNLSAKKQQLALIATFVATMSYLQVKEQTQIALDAGLTPIEIRETIYQTAPYCGYQKALNAMAYVDEMFVELGIEIPLESQATVTDEDRYEKGLEVQRSLFGQNFAAITDDMSEFRKRRVAYVSEYSFGDFMTRSGLDEAERELIVVSVIAALGENQLGAHVGGALIAGNTGDELLAASLLCLPYLGFPRGLNAYGVIEESIATRMDSETEEEIQSGSEIR